MAKYVADGQFRNFQFVEHCRQPSPKSMHPMPLDTRLLCLGNDDVPTQMPEVKRLLRVGGRVKDEASSAVPLQMRVEIFLHDSDYRHGGFAADSLRIFNQYALHDGSLDVHHFVLSVIISPPQALKLLRTQPGECQHHERGLCGMIVNGRYQVSNFFERIRMGISLSAVDAMRRRDRIKIQQASANSRTECAAEEVLGPVIGGLRTNGVAIVFN